MTIIPTVRCSRMARSLAFGNTLRFTQMSRVGSGPPS
jgi:hypothetical protein